MMIKNNQPVVLKEQPVIQREFKQLDTPYYVDNCIFCSRKDNVVVETDNFVIKVGKSIVTEGHVMIVSKRHLKAIAEMDDNLVKEYLELKDKLITFLKKNYYSPFMVEHGNFMQSVFHAHIHFIPKKIAGHEEISPFNDMVKPFLKRHPEIKYVKINKFEDLMNFYREHGKYLYFEEDGEKIAVVVDGISDDGDNLFEKEMNYREFFASMTGEHCLRGWKDMTEEDIKNDNIRVNATKEKFKNNWQ